MAYVQSRCKAALSDYADNKENQPPKRPKKAPPSINDLIKKSKSKHRSARDVLAPLSDGITKKVKSPQKDFFKRFSKKLKRNNSSDDPLRVVPGFFGKIDHDKRQERALDTGYADAAHTYCQSAATEARRRVDQRQAELKARRQGLDLDGHPLRRKGYPSKADFDSLFAQMGDLTKPLEDEMIDVEFKDATTGKSRFRQLRVGTTMDKFFERHTKKRAAVAELAKEIRGVEAEIAALVQQIEREKDGREKDKAETEAEMAELQEEMEGVEDRYKADMKALRKELKAQADEVKRKIADLQAFVS